MVFKKNTDFKHLQKFGSAIYFFLNKAFNIFVRPQGFAQCVFECNVYVNKRFYYKLIYRAPLNCTTPVQFDCVHK